MTKEEAKRLVKELSGWGEPHVEENEDGYCHVTAIDPISRRRMRYDPESGFFV